MTVRPLNISLSHRWSPLTSCTARTYLGFASNPSSSQKPLLRSCAGTGDELAVSPAAQPCSTAILSSSVRGFPLLNRTKGQWKERPEIGSSFVEETRCLEVANHCASVFLTESNLGQHGQVCVAPTAYLKRKRRKNNPQLLW